MTTVMHVSNVRATSAPEHYIVQLAAAFGKTPKEIDGAWRYTQG